MHGKEKDVYKSYRLGMHEKRKGQRLYPWHTWKRKGIKTDIQGRKRKGHKGYSLGVYVKEKTIYKGYSLGMHGKEKDVNKFQH